MYPGIYWIFIIASFSKQYAKAIVCVIVFFALNFITSMYLASFMDISQAQGGFSQMRDYAVKFANENKDKVHRFDFLWILAASYYVADILWTIFSRRVKIKRIK